MRKWGGTCGQCNQDRTVAWVEELGGYRCSNCLCPADRRAMPWSEVVEAPTEEEQRRSIQGSIAAMQELEKALPPRSVGEE